MLLKRINILIIIVIIICSTGFFSLKALGSVQKAVELLGVILILGLLILHIVYGDRQLFKKNFAPFILLIFFGALTSMITASYVREQPMGVSFLAERAIFYYFLYFLLHHFKIRPRDLEIIFVLFGIVHMALYLIQYFAFPKVIFDVFMISHRGTIRIYLPGSDYLALCYFMSMFAWLRTNKIRYMIYMLASFSIFILLGGRQTMALMVFVLILAIFFSRRVKSRLLITALIAGSAVCVFYLFQDIFMEMLVSSNRDRSQGSGYVRIQATKFFLTTFFKNPIAYITGNGVPGFNSDYSKEVSLLRLSKGFYLGDIGVIGSYVMYGLFFILGVAGIFFKVFTTKIKEHYGYIKYMFIGSLLSLATGAGFSAADYICFLCCLLYIVDVSAVSNENITGEITQT